MPNHFKSLTAPAPDFKAVIYDGAGSEIGTASYAESPLYDRTYLFEIRITAEERRKGYATSFLWYLSQTYRHPISPVMMMFGSEGCWESASRLRTAGLHLTEELSVSDMDYERRRRQHLLPELNVWNLELIGTRFVIVSQQQAN